MPSERPPLLYLYPVRTSFIERDIALLSLHFDVHYHALLRGPKWTLPWRLVLQAVFLLRHTAWNKDVICHFAGYHSVLPAIIGRRCLIILAGNDCASFPNIGYGNHRKRLLACATRFSARHATHLLPVDGTLMRCTQTYDADAPAAQGIMSFTINLDTPYTVVPYGFDAVQWRPNDQDERDTGLLICVAVGIAPDNATHLRKGIDLLLQAAVELPSMRFVVVGAEEAGIYTALPSNVQVLGRVGPDELRNLLTTASWYMQVSVMEGFPNALCEAMLCGCIPIVSNVAAMPRIVDSIGIVVPHRNAAELVNALRLADGLSGEERLLRSRSARERIQQQHTMELRADALLKVLQHSP